MLVILLTTDALNTSLSILNCPSISDDNGNKTPVSKIGILDRWCNSELDE